MPQHRLTLLPLALLAGLFTVSAALAGERAIIVLDGSGSMWGQIDGKTKIEIARETLADVLPALPADTELGLMVYGHREKGACGDIELAVEPAVGTADAITAFANKVNPKGKTPISASVKQAAESLRFTEEKATVILVTDGLETCEADPCALANELEQSGVDFTAHVVGFGLSEEEGQQVACLAENTGGKYLKADDAGQLSEALKETVVEVAKAPEPAPKPEPAPAALEHNVVAASRLSEDGPDLGEDDSRVRWDFYPVDANGTRAKRSADGFYAGTVKTNLDAGNYVAVARIGSVTREVSFEAKDGELVEPVIVFNAGTVTITPRYSEGGQETGNEARIDIAFDDGKDGSYGKGTFIAAAGTVQVTARIAKAVAEESFQLAAGETVERDIVIPAGVVVAKAVYAEGGPEVEGNSIRFEIVSAKADISGNRDNFNGTYGGGDRLFVPAGEYLVTARLGEANAEAPVAVEAGSQSEVTINMNAGVLAIAAPGAYRIDIAEAKKDINGNQKKLSGTYGAEFQETLHPGEYAVIVSYEGDQAEKTATATVTAGERAEVTVE